MADFVAQGVDGIVLAPLDSTALVPSVRDAKDAGIPTVIFDSGLADESVIVSYVATDNYHGGVLAAREIGNRLGGKGRRHPAALQRRQRKHRAARTGLSRHDQEGVSRDRHAFGRSVLRAPPRSRPRTRPSNCCNQFGDKVDGFFAVCEPDTVGVLGALEQEGLAGKVMFVGFDPSPHLIEAMREKKVHGLVLQDPVAMGYLSVKTLVERIAGQSGREAHSDRRSDGHAREHGHARDPEAAQSRTSRLTSSTYCHAHGAVANVGSEQELSAQPGRLRTSRSRPAAARCWR